MAVSVSVSGGNGEQAIKNLKRKMQRELVMRSLKEKRCYSPPSEERVKKKKESEQRKRRAIRHNRQDD